MTVLQTSAALACDVFILLHLATAKFNKKNRECVVLHIEHLVAKTHYGPTDELTCPKDDDLYGKSGDAHLPLVRGYNDPGAWFGNF
jgi:hypothetical protein